jgi:hypothetical protein
MATGGVVIWYLRFLIARDQLYSRNNNSRFSTNVCEKTFAVCSEIAYLKRQIEKWIKTSS